MEYKLTRVVTDSVGYVVQVDQVFFLPANDAVIDHHLQIIADANPGAVRNDDSFTHRLTFPDPNGSGLTVTYLSQTA